MPALCHGLTELAEVYTCHAGRHAPNRTPGPSDPGTPRDQIQHMIDLLQQELGLKRAVEPP